MPLKGGYLALAGGGALLLWSGLKGKSVSSALRDVLSGKNPSKAQSANPITSNLALEQAGLGPGAPPLSAPSSATAAKNQAIGKILAAGYGWYPGPQWNALVALWNRESGWDNTVENGGSGAFGIAQALGHGTATSAGTYGNEYPSRAANDGSAAAQISWGLAYIKQTYGTPEAAWAHEQSAGWY